MSKIQEMKEALEELMSDPTGEMTIDDALIMARERKRYEESE